MECRQEELVWEEIDMLCMRNHNFHLNTYNHFLTKALHGQYPDLSRMNHYFAEALDAFIQEAEEQELNEIERDTRRVIMEDIARSRKVVCGSSPQTTPQKRIRPLSLKEYSTSFGSRNKRPRLALHTIMGWPDWQHQGT